MKRLLLCLLLLAPGCVKTKASLAPGEHPPFTITAGISYTNRSATQVRGQDYLAAQLPAFKIGNAAAIPTGSAVGSLDTTFGSSLEPIRTLLNIVKPSYYRVHLINGPCIRNRNCGKYEIGYGYSKENFSKALESRNPKILGYLKQRTLAYKNLSLGFPTTGFLVSPVLEHNLSGKAFAVAADAVKSVWPEVQLVNSPMAAGPAARYLGAWIERHGSQPQRDADIVSTDGASADQIDMAAFLKRTSQAKIVMVWTGSYNCRVPEWQDPRIRKACPTASTMELMPHLFDPTPPPPPLSFSGCRKISAFKAPDIWKPLAERHLNPDPRQELPVLITKGFGKENISVISSTGQKIGSLGYYGTYLTQGFRYYSGYVGGSKQSGYTFQKNSGSLPWVWLQQGNSCKGPLVPGRRQGLMRDS